MAKLKIEFVLKETGEYECFDTTLEDIVMAHDVVLLTNELNGERYSYILGSNKVWKPEGNVLCSTEVPLEFLNLHYEFE